MKNALNWNVYIICCSDNTLYTGITINMARRFDQHCNQQGAKYFRGRRPKALVYIETGHSRRTASQREIAIKKLSRPDKLQLIASAAGRTTDLSTNFVSLVLNYPDLAINNNVRGQLI